MIEPSRRLARSAGRVATVAVREAVDGTLRDSADAMDEAIRADDAACLAIAAARDDDSATLLSHFLAARSHAARVRAFAASRVLPVPGAGPALPALPA